MSVDQNTVRDLTTRIEKNGNDQHVKDILDGMSPQDRQNALKSIEELNQKDRQHNSSLHGIELTDDHGHIAGMVRVDHPDQPPFLTGLMAGLGIPTSENVYDTKEDRSGVLSPDAAYGLETGLNYGAQLLGLPKPFGGAAAPAKPDEHTVDGLVNTPST